MKVYKMRQKIKIMILDSGRSQAEIAKMLGVSRQHLNYTLNKCVKLSTLEKLEKEIKEVI